MRMVEVNEFVCLNGQRQCHLEIKSNLHFADIHWPISPANMFELSSGICTITTTECPLGVGKRPFIGSGAEKPEISEFRFPIFQQIFAFCFGFFTIFFCYLNFEIKFLDLFSSLMIYSL
jgi:hypothetical protein